MLAPESALPWWSVWTLLGAAMAAAAVLIYYLGRGTTFFYDEWNFLLDRRAWTVNAFLAPHGGHLSVVPVFVYHLMWSVFGMCDYGPYRLVLIAFHLLCAGLVFEIARRRINAILALSLAGLVLFLGSAWQDLLWPFQVGFLGSIAAGLGALLALEYDSGLSNIAAALLLAVAVGSSALGIPFLVGVAVFVVWSPRPLERIWIVAFPALLFGAWYLAWRGEQATVDLHNLARLPSYLARSATAAFAGMTGLSGQRQLISGLLLVAITIAGIVVLRSSWRSARLAMLVTMPLVFWSLTGLARGQLDEPGASRYLYPGAVFLILVLVEVLQRTPQLPPLVGLIALPIIASNVLALHAGAVGLRNVSISVRAELASVELARAAVPADFQPDLQLMPQVTAGRYLAAVGDLGSPADPPQSLPNQPESAREAADSVLVRALGVELRPVRALLDGCQTYAGDDSRLADLSQADLTLSFAAQGSQPVSVFLRRFASVFPQIPLGTAGPSINGGLAIPPDAASVPWHVRLISAAPVTICQR